ncbi:hypothetical protein GGF46_004614 [Coemansia sp. RSA 552]|nr:hypothetical protein GGF46_004614 [Coemansia sp. RSA 552]
MPVAAAAEPTDTAVLESARFIAENSRDVWVPEDGVKQAASQIMERMKQAKYSTALWKKHTLTPSVADLSAIEWIFVVDALNFSFWPNNPQAPYTVTLDQVEYRGYWSLCAAVNRALQEGIPITSASFYAHMTRDKVAAVFRTDDPGTQEPMPMLDERVQVLNEVGRVLVDKYQGRFASVVEQSGGSARRLVELVVRDFPCFRDEHSFHGRPVCLYKRAQILVADIWACFEGRGLGRFDDIDCVTMFADYRVPQALCHFGALSYSPRLQKYLVCSERAVYGGSAAAAAAVVACPPEPGLLPSGHPWEVEIRGNSIWAVERICQHIRAAGMQVNAILIDFYLWDTAKEHSDSMRTIPIHLTRSVFY